MSDMPVGEARAIGPQAAQLAELQDTFRAETNLDLKIRNTGSTMRRRELFKAIPR